MMMMLMMMMMMRMLLLSNRLCPGLGGSISMGGVNLTAADYSGAPATRNLSQPASKWSTGPLEARPP